MDVCVFTAFKGLLAALFSVIRGIGVANPMLIFFPPNLA
jgi:hypothetical protein